MTDHLFRCPHCSQHFTAPVFVNHLKTCKQRDAQTDEDHIAAYAKSVADDLEMRDGFTPYEKRLHDENQRRFGNPNGPTRKD